MSTLQLTGDSVVWIGLSLGSVVLVLVYLLNQWRIRKRDAHLKLDSTQSLPERAENQIKLARAGADHLYRQGYDVSAVERAIAEADAALGRRNYTLAIRVAEESREKLVAIREGRAPTPPSNAGRTPVSVLPVAAMVVAGTGGGPSATSAPPIIPPAENRPKLPTHQVEARFELTLLEEELAKPAHRGADATARNEAAELAKKARSAYEAKNFSEAWQLALRGRRRVGSSIEHIGGRRPIAGNSEAARTVPLEPAEAVVPEEEPVGTACPSCGRPIRANDRFCRACGTTLGAERCPRCGAPQDPSDRFCGVCGSPVGG